MHANVRHRPRFDGGEDCGGDGAAARGLVAAKLAFDDGCGRTGGIGARGWALPESLPGGGGAAMSAHIEQVAHAESSVLKKYLWSTDHKVIAMQYLFTGMAMALLGAFFAYGFRMQLGFPGRDV